jgi:RNA-directed DNA polymerase
MNYYGAFYPSALYPLLARINAYLLRWLRKKHKRLRGRRKAQDAWNRAVRQRPRFFAHWAWVWSIPGFMHTWFCVTQLRQVALL